MPDLRPYKGGYYLWLYLPSTPAAAVFTALFAIGTIYTTWRMIRTRAWFCTVFIIGGIFQIIGYVARALARNKTEQLMPFVIQSTLILVSPALFAASVYMVLGRVIRSVHAEQLSMVPIKWLTAIFVLGDVVSFVVQASGAGVMVTDDGMDMGEKIILGGLFVQIIVFGLFAATSAVFHIRIRRHRPTTSLDYGSNWEKIMTMLYVVSALIMVRSVFRVVEYIMGHDGYLLAHEWTLYVFDATLMFGVVAMFVWRFPGDLLPSMANAKQDVEMPSRTLIEEQEPKHQS